MRSVIKIKDIIIKKRLRKLNSVKVDELAESIKEQGLINPITINNHSELLAGLHRLEACKKLGFIDIDCNILPHLNLDAELIEIDENLIRNELTALENGDCLRRRKEIYEIKFPETKQGIAGGKARQNSASEKNSFAKDTALKTGLSPRTIQQGVQIGNIIPEVKEKILNLPIADKKIELLQLSRLEPAKQAEAVDKYISGEIAKIEEFEESEMSDEEWEKEECNIAMNELKKWINKYQSNKLIKQFLETYYLMDIL